MQICILSSATLFSRGATVLTVDFPKVPNSRVRLRRGANFEYLPRLRNVLYELLETRLLEVAWETLAYTSTSDEEDDPPLARVQVYVKTISDASINEREKLVCETEERDGHRKSYISL